MKASNIMSLAAIAISITAIAINSGTFVDDDTIIPIKIQEGQAFNSNQTKVHEVVPARMIDARGVTTLVGLVEELEDDYRQLSAQLRHITREVLVEYTSDQHEEAELEIYKRLNAKGYNVTSVTIYRNQIAVEYK